MSECNLCGQNFEKLNKAEVEGTIVQVCNNCLKFGRKIETPQTTYRIQKKIDFKNLGDDDLLLISGYGEKMRKARESLGLSRIQLAEKMKEKESVIKRLEEEKMEPDEKLLKRIEKLLRINLTEEYKEMKSSRKKEKGKLTVGDIINFE
ncbi:MAG: multiprotein bridging factor aMBF1 [Candidatus Aenigmatarchaeota archaeon]